MSAIAEAGLSAEQRRALEQQWGDPNKKGSELPASTQQIVNQAEQARLNGNGRAELEAVRGPRKGPDRLEPSRDNSADRQNVDQMQADDRLVRGLQNMDYDDPAKWSKFLTESDMTLFHTLKKKQEQGQPLSAQDIENARAVIAKGEVAKKGQEKAATNSAEIEDTNRANQSFLEALSRINLQEIQDQAKRKRLEEFQKKQAAGVPIDTADMPELRRLVTEAAAGPQATEATTPPGETTAEVPSADFDINSINDEDNKKLFALNRDVYDKVNYWRTKMNRPDATPLSDKDKVVVQLVAREAQALLKRSETASAAEPTTVETSVEPPITEAQTASTAEPIYLRNEEDRARFNGLTDAEKTLYLQAEQVIRSGDEGEMTVKQNEVYKKVRPDQQETNEQKTAREKQEKEQQFEATRKQFLQDWKDGNLRSPDKILEYVNNPEVADRLIKMIQSSNSLKEALGVDTRDTREKIIDKAKIAVGLIGLPMLLLSIFVTGDISKIQRMDAFKRT